MNKDKEISQLLKLTKEDNKILHRLDRSAKVGRFFNVLYWVVIIASISGVYYYFQPYLDKVIEVYDKASSILRDIGNNIPTK